MSDEENKASTPKERFGSKLSGVIQRLIKINAFSGLVSSALIAVVLPLSVWLGAHLRESANQVSYTLCIKIPDALSQMPFTVRHVRDGAGESPSGLAYKEDLLFPKPTSDNRSCQVLSFPRHVGIIFKIYVTYGDMNFEYVRKILEDAGYTDISSDSQPTLRKAWFINPNFIRITHGSLMLKGEVIDNFYVD
jgi:hypothetical protein